MEMLKGKKTYIIAVLVGVVAALEAAAIIDSSVAENLYAALGAGGLATLRMGVGK